MRDTDLALKVLRDPAFNSGLSGFFGDTLPTRAAQAGLGRAVRETVRAHVPTYGHDMARAVDGIPAVSAWPMTGLMLVHRASADLLLHPGVPASLGLLLRRFVRSGLVRSPRLRHRVQAEAHRLRLVEALTGHVAERRAESVRAPAPRDVLDAVIGACPEEVTDRTAAQLYIMLVVAIVGPLGYTVAWSVLLACLHHRPGASWPWPTDWITREAARHRPVAWMVGRRVPSPARYGGVDLRPGTTLSVSPYLLHHDQNRWTDAQRFSPERWGEPAQHGPYLPFSAGPFSCAGAAVAQTLVTATVTALTAGARLSVRGRDIRTVVTDASIPGPFELQRAPAH
ncbi:cytochrome P450 [Streptomyces paludis]|uniref:cytochrome P450 n=1 Tax=Streptomyces paludis TaxID=2282738 RepID=UPI001E541CCF|nr:cytochrome P450 [Streptomyces paludis]